MIDLDELDGVLHQAMAEHTQECVLGAGAARRALRGARRRRRTSAAAVAAGGLALIGGAALARAGLGPGPVSTSVAGTDGADPVLVPQATVSGYPQDWAVVPGISPVMVYAQSDGTKHLMWMSKGANLVFGVRERAGADVKATLFTPLSELQDPGMYRAYSGASLPPDSPAPVTTVVVGLVRGPRTRVVVDLPSGPVPAHLVTTADQAGTLYWVTTEDFGVNGQVVVGRQHGRVVNEVVGISVFDGAKRIFHCAGNGCVGSTTG